MKSFKDYLKSEGVKVPESELMKRELFIKWYLNESQDTSIDVIIHDLANHFLFLSEKTTENLIFQDAKRYR